MGILSGVVATLAVIPSAIALFITYDAAYTESAQHRANYAAAALSAWLEVADAGAGATLRPFDDLQADGLYLLVNGKYRERTGVHEQDEAFLKQVCAGTADTMEPLMRHHAWACAQAGNTAIVVQITPKTPSMSIIVGFVLTLSTIVGIIMALGVLRLLAPLTRVNEALKRVTAGERGVRVQPSGLPELDELVYRLNNAAQAVEERQDAVLARIEVVQDMARLVAHEVRNPLQSLEILTTLIAAEESIDERRELAGSIHDEIRGLDQVVNRLLRRGAGGSLRLVRADDVPSDVVRRVAHSRGPEAKAAGVRIVLGELSTAVANIDAALLARSIDNLIRNAMQAANRSDAVIELGVTDTPDEVVITVDDNGPGVAPEVHDHMFDPHITGRVGGTGLGLALVRGVIEAHGGRVLYEASPLGGARFTVHIPKNEVDGDSSPASGTGSR